MIERNDFNNEIIQWSSRYLLSHGYALKSNLPEIIQNTPWSYVIRFATIPFSHFSCPDNLLKRLADTAIKHRLTTEKEVLLKAFLI